MPVGHVGSASQKASSTSQVIVCPHIASLKHSPPWLHASTCSVSGGQVGMAVQWTGSSSMHVIVAPHTDSWVHEAPCGHASTWTQPGAQLG